ncbi:MAG: hypothetical protein EOO39_51320, partial [Cytophagaceae bacterium]
MLTGIVLFACQSGDLNVGQSVINPQELLVQSIDSVKLVRQTPQGESIIDFRPFYSLKHGQTPEQNGHYWV